MTTASALIVPCPDRGSVAAVVAVVVLLGAAAGGSAAGLSAEGQLVYETQTTYQELRVVDSDGIRTLYLDGQRHSAMDIDTPNRHVFAYTRYFHLPMLMTEDVDRVLFVGGGGFTGPRRFIAEYDATVDVVELDPAVVETARRHFRLPASDRLNVYVGDGRAFLRETDHTYDLIILDAYRQDKVPFHLTTVEFMHLASGRLDDDGVLLANLIAAPSGPASRFYRAEYRTMQRVFPQVYTFTTVDGPVVQNIEVVATRNATRLPPATLHARNERRNIGVDLETEIDQYRPPPRTDDVPVLRDDRAPVSRLMDPMLGQEYVVQETNGTISTARTVTAE